MVGIVALAPMRPALRDVARPCRAHGQRTRGLRLCFGFGPRLSFRPEDFGGFDTLAFKVAGVGLLVHQHPQAVRLGAGGFDGPSVRIADGLAQRLAVHLRFKDVGLGPGSGHADTQTLGDGIAQERLFLPFRAAQGGNQARRQTV